MAHIGKKRHSMGKLWACQRNIHVHGAGAAASGAVAVAPGLRVYQLTENGLALQATVHGTKFWRDAFVNGDKK